MLIDLNYKIHERGTRMKSVLYGNGINIQFSEETHKDDYKNHSIISRLMETLKWKI